jgi:hypothetical protein
MVALEREREFDTPSGTPYLPIGFNCPIFPAVPLFRAALNADSVIPVYSPATNTTYTYRRQRVSRAKRRGRGKVVWLALAGPHAKTTLNQVTDPRIPLPNICIRICSPVVVVASTECTV